MCTDHRPAHAWFLKIVSVRTSVCMCACMCVCPPPRLLITGGVMWRDMDPKRLAIKFYSCYVATVVIIVHGCALALVGAVDTNPIRVS